MTLTAKTFHPRVREGTTRVERYKFNVRPGTDERPYFFHSFRWSALPELLQLRARGGMPLMEWGYLVLVAGLAQALVASIALILLPLLFVRRRTSLDREPTWRLVVYFGSIGLAFLRGLGGSTAPRPCSAPCWRRSSLCTLASPRWSRSRPRFTRWFSMECGGLSRRFHIR